LQNRSNILRETHARHVSHNDIDVTDISQDITALHAQSSQLVDNSFLLTEAKLEVGYKMKFTLNQLRSKVLQSPQTINSSLGVNRNSSNGSKNNSIL
jgi:hypothetical protein